MRELRCLRRPLPHERHEHDRGRRLHARPCPLHRLRHLREHLPGGALTLRRKPDEQLNPVDSKDIYELHDRIQKEYRARVAAEAEQ